MKKRLFLLLLCICLASAAWGCKTKQEKINDSKKDAYQVKDDPDSSEENKDPLLPDISEEYLNAETAKDNELDLLNSTWDVAAFQLFSTTYSVPFSYARISSDWTFDLTDYGYDETFMLQPGERTTATVELYNPDVIYPMIVGFYNPYDVPITIEESQVWSVSFDFSSFLHDSDKDSANDNTDDSAQGTLPESTEVPMLPSNITYLTDIVDVIIAYDTPSTPFSYNPETLTYDLYYQVGHEIFVTLFIDAEYGLQKFIIQNYGN